VFQGAAQPGATLRRKRRCSATAGLLIGAVALLAFVPACSSSSTPAAVSTTTSTSTSSLSSSITSTTSSVTLPEQDPAELAACVSDAQALTEALATYMAEKGTYPSPPAAWSAATYAANFQPLTAASGGGSFLASPPGTRYYVIEYDSAGHVWVAPPGAYGPYDKGQDFAADPNICDAAVG
jgi:hypothetical protein